VIVLVNVFEVHGAPAEFESAFGPVSEWMRGRPGFITHRLLRSHMSPSTYVNVAEWDDEQSLRAALTHPEAVGLMSALTRVSTPAPQTYRTVLEAPALEAPEGEAPPREAA
jgi:heme-degrading monooxygenase HmoA